MTATVKTLSDLTPAQQAVLEQIQWLQTHFESKFGCEAFSQSNYQFERKLKLSRRTVQTAVQTLENLGLITVGRNLGYGGSNLFYMHKDKLIAFLSPVKAFTDKVRAAFTEALEIGKTCREWKEATATFDATGGVNRVSTSHTQGLDLSWSLTPTETHVFNKYQVWWTSEAAAAEAKKRDGF